MEHNDAYFFTSVSMQFCVFGKIIIIILRCWLLQLTTIHITELQHPSHKNTNNTDYNIHLRTNFIIICITVGIIALKSAHIRVHEYGFEESQSFISLLAIRYNFEMPCSPTEIKFNIHIMFPFIQFFKKCLYKYIYTSILIYQHLHLPSQAQHTL